MRLRTSQTGHRIEHGHGVVSAWARRLDAIRLSIESPFSPRTQRAAPHPASPINRLALLSLLVFTTACDQPLTEQSQENSDETFKLPAIQSVSAKAFPATRPDAGLAGAVDGLVKPGHWTAASISLRSNREDLRGEIQTQAAIDTDRRGGLRGASSSKKTKPFSASAFAESVSGDVATLPVRRPAVLPQGQQRRLDTRLLVPAGRLNSSETVHFGGTFSSRAAATVHPLQSSVWPTMPAQAYFFVILTERPEQFTRLQTADWVRHRWDDRMTASEVSDENYRIMLPPTDGVLPIAETALDWTSTSVLLWDNLPARALTPMQRTAILDWVHFGGTFIINGPDAADALSGDELDDLTLIRDEGLRELDAESTGRWLDSMSVSSDRSISDVKTRLADGTARVALAGTPRPGAISVGVGDAVWVCRLGRGRVVQSRFDLLSDWLTRWKSYDSFFNNAVLGRPPRVVEKTSDWALQDESFTAIRQRFVGQRADQTPPQINTGLRWFSRDARLPAARIANQLSAEDTDLDTNPDADLDSSSLLHQVGDEPLDPTKVATTGETTTAPPSDSDSNPSSDLWSDAYFAPDPTAGLGGWNDTSPWLTLFQQTLEEEVGITIPDSSLVVRSLAIYLALLVPANYVFFRIIGRLEWAWWAVIPIAVGGALMVARAAQLDVGLVRSRNELALLELQPNHSRGHLTRLVAIYNSLANSYTIQFDTPDTCITTVNSTSGDSRGDELFRGQPAELTLGYDTGPSLQGVRVGSNSYVTLHTEQIFSVGGAIELQRRGESPPNERISSFGTTPDATNLGDGDWRLMNRSELDIADAILVAHPNSGPVQVAVIGGLGPQEQARIRLQSADASKVPAELPMQMSDLMARLLSAQGIPPGSIRLVGRVDKALPGMSLSPEVQQTRGQTLLLAHLAYPPLQAPQVDENLIQDFGLSTDPSHESD